LVAFVIIILFSLCLNIINNNIIFSLNGDLKNTILVNSNYVDEGFEARIFNKDISEKVNVISDFDVNKIGNYYIRYELNYLFRNYILEREVAVIDYEKPLIYLNGEENMILYVGDSYIEHGAVANDNYDGDLSSSIVVEGSVDTSKSGTYIIKYIIRDSSGNESSVVRNINVKPKIVVTPSVKYNCIKYYDNYTDDNQIVRYVKDNNLRVSIGYYNLINGDSFFYNSSKVYYGASLLKTLDAIYVYDNNIVNDTVKGWVEKAISVSDNDSHYYLYNYIGLDNLQKYGFSLGACNTLVGTDNYGNTSVSDQMVYLKKLYEITLNNDELKSYFINDYGNYLNFDDVKFMHKYGYYGGYYHNVGIVLDDEPYIVVILTEHGYDNFKLIINEISKLVYEYHQTF